MKKLIVGMVFFIVSIAVPSLALSKPLVSLVLSVSPTGSYYAGNNYSASLTLTNNVLPAGSQVQLNGLSTKSSFPAGFSIASSTCGSAGTAILLTFGQSCIITGTFTPSTEGTNAWNLYLIAYGMAYNNDVYSASVTVLPASTTSVSLEWTTPLPTSSIAGDTAVNAVLSVTNNGNVAVSFSTPATTIVAVNAADFSTAPTATTCGSTLAVGATCTYTWRYQALSTGSKSLIATINYNGTSVTSAATTSTAQSGYTVTPIVEPQSCTTCKGSTSPSAPYLVAAGNSLAVTLTPSTGASISGTSGSCGGTLSSSVYTINNINADCTVYAAFMQEYDVTTSASNPWGITAGPDGNLWFTEYNGNNIGKITTTGTIVEYSIPTAGSQPLGITAGPDGNLWFTEFNGNKIGKITTTGTIVEYSIPTAGSQPRDITAGPDGNLWFTEYNGNKIAQITTTGTIVEYSIPTANSQPWDITAGPDGNLWFTEFSSHKIGKITTAGIITEYSIPPGSFSVGITAGPDGNLWFSERSRNKIGKITTAGTIVEYSIPTANSQPWDITAGPDGNLWFTEHNGNNIGKITTTGTIVEYSIPTAGGLPLSITAGPDGNLWFTEYNGNKIGVL